jgi:hypothetical protein
MNALPPVHVSNVSIFSYCFFPCLAEGGLSLLCTISKYCILKEKESLGQCCFASIFGPAMRCAKLVLIWTVYGTAPQDLFREGDLLRHAGQKERQRSEKWLLIQ